MCPNQDARPRLSTFQGTRTRGTAVTRRKYYATHCKYLVTHRSAARVDIFITNYRPRSGTYDHVPGTSSVDLSQAAVVCPRSSPLKQHRQETKYIRSYNTVLNSLMPQILHEMVLSGDMTVRIPVREPLFRASVDFAAKAFSDALFKILGRTAFKCCARSSSGPRLIQSLFSRSATTPRLQLSRSRALQVRRSSNGSSMNPAARSCPLPAT